MRRGSCLAGAVALAAVCACGGGGGGASLADLTGRWLLTPASSGVEGDSFAHGLASLAGEEVYAAVAGLGKPGILQALQSVPDVWAAIAPRAAALSVFVDQFLAYGEPEPEDDAAAISTGKAAG